MLFSRSSRQFGGLGLHVLTLGRTDEHYGAKLPIAVIATNGNIVPFKTCTIRRTRRGTGSCHRHTGHDDRDTGVGCRRGLLWQPLPLQLLYAGTDCLEIVSCSGP